VAQGVSTKMWSYVLWNKLRAGIAWGRKRAGENLYYEKCFELLRAQTLIFICSMI
jgi:hypothetical protein